MKKSILASGVLVSLFFALVPGHAQEVAKLTLRLEQTIPVRAVTGGFSLPLKCDREGNVYIRSASSFREPVLKVSPDGQKLTDFSLASVPAWENGEFYDFAIRPDGEVYLLAARRGQRGKIESAILQFNEQGRFRFATALDFDPFYVNQFDVFSTGEFLISGWKREQPTRNGQTGKEPAQEEELVEPLLAVVNPAGEMVHRLRFAPADEEAASKTPETLPRSAISLATTAAGDDGFLYLMLREEKARILVISPVGGVVKSLEVTPPGENLSPMSLRFTPGVGLLVQFGERVDERRFDPRNGVLSLVHPQTGERLVDYQLNPELGGILGCHTSRGFLFVQVNPQRQVAFHRAVPR